MNRLYITFIFLLLSSVNSYGFDFEDIRIRLFSSYSGRTVIVSSENSSYWLIAKDIEGNTIDTISSLNIDNHKEDKLYFWLKSGRIHIRKNKLNLGSFDNVSLSGIGDNSTFRIKYARQKERVYDGSISIAPKGNAIEVVNIVDMPSYIAGVVESEVGSRGDLEFYKVQSILVRTYAIKNHNKFISKGYNLTDDVRSQVYFSKSHFPRKSKIIKEAVKLTDGLIVIYNNRIIDPVFHANSGGQTLGAVDVWNFEFPYLQPVKDPYSVLNNSDNSKWNKKISKEEFLHFFYNKAPLLVNDKKYKESILSFHQKKRLSTFKYKDIEIPLTEIRREFRLKSTFFDVIDKGDVVVLNGKGYGHGVGLAQIGAINMAKKGFTYQQIIKFYFTGVKVVPISEDNISE